MGKQKMVQAVKEYALAHYGQDGWDYIVECWTDEEIAEEIKDCLSESGAIREMRQIAKLFHSQRTEGCF